MAENRASPTDADGSAFLAPWTAWLKAAATLADTHTPGAGQGPTTPNLLNDSLLDDGVRRFGEFLAKDPLLLAGENALNANPLRRGHPGRLGGDRPRVAHRLAAINFAEPADRHRRGDRVQPQTVSRPRWIPGPMPAQRWWGMPRPPGRGKPPAGDKRFAAPEWQTNPVYRTLKELYFLASEWLLHQPADRADLNAAERQRLDFHLRQFVDAMSPTLMLAVQPGGAAAERWRPAAPASRRCAQPDARRAGRPAEHGGHQGLRAGPQPRDVAGQGGVPQQADRVDPVRPDHAQRCTPSRC